MKQSDINHLRRLLAWVKTETGQTPEELEVTLKGVADKLGHPDISEEAKARLVESHDKARAVPIYVRDAIKALDKYIKSDGPIVEADAESAGTVNLTRLKG